MNLPRTQALVAVFGALAVGALSACGSSASSGNGTGTTATNAVATAASTAGDTTPTTATAQVATKVSANTATEQEITAALEAAGVQNAARWTREVMEYRPYDEADASLAQLRTELQKYNPAADQLEKILGALTP